MCEKLEPVKQRLIGVDVLEEGLGGRFNPNAVRCGPPCSNVKIDDLRGVGVNFKD
jgi:hypothetical protein